MSKKISLEEQIAKHREKLQVLKRKKEEDERKQRKANLTKIGNVLDKLGFDLSDTSLLAGCIAYAMDSMQTTPGLDEEFRTSGLERLSSQNRSN